MRFIDSSNDFLVDVPNLYIGRVFNNVLESYYPGPGSCIFSLSTLWYFYPILKVLHYKLLMISYEKAKELSFFEGLYYPGPGISIVAFSASFLSLDPIDIPGLSTIYSIYNSDEYSLLLKGFHIPMALDLHSYSYQ